jgi:hypothetical protein
MHKTTSEQGTVIGPNDFLGREFINKSGDVTTVRGFSMNNGVFYIDKRFKIGNSFIESGKQLKINIKEFLKQIINGSLTMLETKDSLPSTPVDRKPHLFSSENI